MAHTLATRDVAAAGRSAPAFNVFSFIIKSLAVWRQRRQLAVLDPHLRRDLGLSTLDVAHESTRPFWDLPQTRQF